MARGGDNTSDQIATHAKAFAVWIWMAGVLAAMFITVWVLGGEVRLTLL
jgi:hypothetical protein